MDAAAIRYVLASLLSVVITLGVPIVMVELGGFDPSRAAATALLLALVANFLVLKSYVYRNDGRWQAQAVRYLLVAASFRLGEYFVFLALYKLLGWFYVAALVVTLGVSFIAKFFAYYYLVFAGRDKDDRTTPRRLTRWRAMRN
jgi:putative flippase GtrA